MRFLIGLLFAYSLFAGTYDDNYKIQEPEANSKVELDAFMYGYFKEIIRFDMLEFNENKLVDSNKTHYNSIVQTIKEYKQKGENIRLTIIGHTNEATDNHNEKVIDSDTYANAIQNRFRYALDTNTSQKLSEDYAQKILDAFIADEIDKEITVVEYRRGDDMAFSDGTIEGRNLSNRVMVTMYVLYPQDKDSDKDGVFDRIDECPDTPKGAKVDSFGCAIDSDRDGIIDFKDECPDTPFGVKVDKKGCPYDSDGDGVLDYTDECPGTPSDFRVDGVGCPLSKELGLNFKTNSDEILENSYSEVAEFAEFLKQNPAYEAEIIGHTDNVGKADANIILSQKRAASVKAALISEGVEPSRLTTDGRGELEPIQTNKTKEGKKANRRTEIKLSYKKQN